MKRTKHSILSTPNLVMMAILVAIVLWYFLNRTRTGLNLRAVGENPATADAAGINVTRYQYLAACIGAGGAGAGAGVYIYHRQEEAREAETARTAEMARPEKTFRQARQIRLEAGTQECRRRSGREIMVCSCSGPDLSECRLHWL